MIYQGTYEAEMLKHEENKDLNNAIKDTVAVLNQEGYKAGADVLQRMLSERLAEYRKGE